MRPISSLRPSHPVVTVLSPAASLPIAAVIAAIGPVTLRERKRTTTPATAAAISNPVSAAVQPSSAAAAAMYSMSHATASLPNSPIGAATSTCSSVA